MNEHKAKLSADLISEIEREVQNLRDAIGLNDGDKMKDATNKVKNCAMKIGQAIYSQAQNNQQQSGDQQQQQSGDQQQGGEGQQGGENKH